MTTTTTKTKVVFATLVESSGTERTTTLVFSSQSDYREAINDRIPVIITREWRNDKHGPI